MKRYFTNKKSLKFLRKKLRKESSDAENKIWDFLKGKRLGVKFRRQHSINNYILDFYAPSIKLCIEVDGDYHDSPEMIISDNCRDEFLESIGIKVLRLDARSICTDFESTTEEIYNTVTHP